MLSFKQLQLQRVLSRARCELPVKVLATRFFSSIKTANSSRPTSSLATATTHDSRLDRLEIPDVSVGMESFAHLVISNNSVAAPTTRSNFEAWMVNLRAEDVWLKSDRPLDWFTGKAPLPGVCPGVSSDGRIRSIAAPNLNKVTRKAFQDYFDNSWTLNETLFAGFKGEEAFYRPPVHGLRHPQIFYYGHTPCFYVNKLRVAGLLQGPVNAYMESIFEVGVDEMLWDDMHKNDMIWPTVAEVQEYRKQVYRVVSEVIATHPSLDDTNGPIKVTWDHPLWSVVMGVEHEHIHLETSSVLFRETPLNLMQVPKAWPSLHPSAKRVGQGNRNPVEGQDFQKNELISVKGEVVNLGKSADFPSHGWDNEYGHRTVQVPSFSASKFMVTNGEFWQFVAAGGYRTEKYWSSDGWAWRKYRNLKWPFFWQADGPQGSMQFKLRTIFEVTDMQWDWPVDVNYHEAKAYCAWKSEQDGLLGKPEAYRVITEAEHQIIRDQKARPEKMLKGEDDRCLRVDGDHFASSDGAANLNCSYASQSPVGSFSPSETGHYDTMGNAWEWTEDHFNPLTGFKVHHFYDDFSTPCFDGRHHMIMGGSFMSVNDNGGSGFCRFHFRPHFLQHSGFRLVSSSHPAPAGRIDDSTATASETSEAEKSVLGSASGTGAAIAGSDGYETKGMVDQYLGFHFPLSADISGKVEPLLSHPEAPIHALGFAQRVAKVLLKEMAKGDQPKRRALDLGCSVGGTSFELAAGGFEEVLGVDFSASFIETAQRMQRGEEIPFQVPLEGRLQAEHVARHESNVDVAVRSRVSFQTGDACRLFAEDIGTFDGAVLANLLCRLPDPLLCLDGLQRIMRPGGVVAIFTPFSWLEDFTPKSKWLGGFVDADTRRPVSSKEQLQLHMQKRDFVKLNEEQVPFLIREHQRKYTYGVSEATLWRRV